MRKTIITIAVLAVLIGVTLPTAIAQETNETQTPTETIGTESGSVIQVDDYVTVTNYRFQENTIIVTLEVERTSLIKVSDMFVAGTGAQQIPTKTMRLDSGKNTIRMDTTPFKGMQGVVIATPQGTIGITKSTSQFTLFEGETARSNVVLGTAFGGIFGISLVIFVAWKRELSISTNTEQEL